MAGEIGQLEIGAKINKEQLQNDVRSIERDLGKVGARAEQTTGTIERMGKSATLVGGALVGMATAGTAALTNLTKNSPYLIDENVRTEIAKTQIGLEGGKITEPIAKIKASIFEGLANLISGSPEKIGGLFGIGTIAGGIGSLGAGAGILGSLLSGAGATGIGGALAGFGGSALAGGGIGLVGGLAGTGLNWLTDKIGLTNQEQDAGSTIGRFLAQAGGGAAVGAGAGALFGGVGAVPGAIIGAIGGLISAGFQEYQIRRDGNPENRRYEETRQEYYV